MKKYKVIFGFLFSLVLLTSSLSAQAVKIFPRVGVELGELEAEDSLAKIPDHGNGDTIVFTAGVNAGLLFYMKDKYIDFSVNLLPYDLGVSGTDGSMPNSGWRSDINLTYGHRAVADTFLIAGARMLGYGKDPLGKTASQDGYFVGMSMTNMEWDKHLVSVTVAQLFGTSVTSDGSLESGGSMIRVAWREKDSHGLWHFKGENFGPGITSSFLGVGYTYLFF